MCFHQLLLSCFSLHAIKLYVCLNFLCRLVRAAHAKGANIILIQVCIVGTCSIWLLEKKYFLECIWYIFRSTPYFMFLCSYDYLVLLWNIYCCSTTKCLLPLPIIKICNDKLESVHVNDTRGPWSLFKRLLRHSNLFFLHL